MYQVAVFTKSNDKYIIPCLTTQTLVEFGLPLLETSDLVHAYKIFEEGELVQPSSLGLSTFDYSKWVSEIQWVCMSDKTREYFEQAGVFIKHTVVQHYRNRWVHVKSRYGMPFGRVVGMSHYNSEIPASLIFDQQIAPV